jgi:hypothetical protein
MFVRYPKLSLSTTAGLGLLGTYNGWKVTEYDEKGKENLIIDRSLCSLANGLAYATPFTWPVTAYCLARRAEIHIKNLDKSEYDWLYREYFGIGRDYPKRLKQEKLTT